MPTVYVRFASDSQAPILHSGSGKIHPVHAYTQHNGGKSIVLPLYRLYYFVNASNIILFWDHKLMTIHSQQFCTSSSKNCCHVVKRSDFAPKNSPRCVCPGFAGDPASTGPLGQLTRLSQIL